MELDCLTIWEATKKRLDGFAEQIKEVMRQEASTEGELEAIEEARRPIVANLAALKQKHADLEVTMKAEAARACEGFMTKKIEAKEERQLAVPGAPAPAGTVPIILESSCKAATADDEHNEAVPVVQECSPAAGSNHKAIVLTNQGRSTAALEEDHVEVSMSDGEDADFTAMDKWTSSKTETHKRERASSPSCSEADEIKPEPKTTTPARKLPRTEPKPVDCIRPEYPTIVRDDQRRWVELRCHICGVNYSRQKKAFIRGSLGMHFHYIKGHQETTANGDKLLLKECVRLATYHVLSDEEVGGILGGEENAYAVEIVKSARPRS